MAITVINEVMATPPGPSGFVGGLKRWLALLLSVAALLGFVFGLAPWFRERVDSVNQLAGYIDASGIDAGAVYYTEVEEVSDADLMIRDTFRFYLGEQEQRLKD